MRAEYWRYVLEFKEPATTSRETMTSKETFFIKLWNEERPETFGMGECAIFRGLSADDTPDYEERLSRYCEVINQGLEVIPTESSIAFGYQSALADLEMKLVGTEQNNAWRRGELRIPINGLVWMGSIDEMSRRVEQKLEQGFRCIKFKIGGQDFEQEFALLRGLRERFSPAELEIRLDANGAFRPEYALERLKRLSRLSIHSIEQPIKPRQWSEMAHLCNQSPIPIALDEELIGLNGTDTKARMLDAVKPQYIILKPALCGGFSGADEWISLAQEWGIGWWATSALESNVGLDAIARWLSGKDFDMPQGLGTGALYTNNIPMPIRQEGACLCYGGV